MAKFFVIASFLLFLPYGSAAVADVPGSSYNWTGFYAGLNMGGAVNDSKYTLSPSGNFLTDPTVSPTENPLRTDRAGHGGGAFTGGGQLGYNYQSGSLVFGVETDFNYDGINDSDSVNRLLQSPLIGSFVHTVTQKVDCFGTVRGRLGYTPCNRLLVYGTGGFAYGDVSSISDALFTLAGDHYVGSSSGLQAGWTAGGGIEYAITRCWSVKVEYLLVELGKTYTYGGQFNEGYSYTTHLDTTKHIFRLGLNYKF